MNMKENWLKERRYNTPLILDSEMFVSKAYLDLKPASVRLLIEVYRRIQVTMGKSGKIKTYNIRNNGQIQLSYDSIQKCCGMARGTTSSAIKDLIEHGFIEMTHQGSGVQHDMSLFAVITDWKIFGTDNFIPRKKKEPVRTSKGTSIKKKRDTEE